MGFFVVLSYHFYVSLHKMDLPDENGGFSATLTIEVDDGQVPTEKSYNEGVTTSEKASGSLPWIRPPLTIEDVQVRVDCSVKVGDLANAAITLLCSHLNLHAYGSLRNWETVGAKLGLDSNDIMALRNEKKPMEIILRNHMDQPAISLFKALESSRRIDLLYSLKELQRNNVLERMESTRGIHSKSTSIVTQYPLGNSNIFSVKNILVIHHEETKEEVKCYKWFVKNLRVYSSQLGNFPIVDFNDLNADKNIATSLHHAFAQAYQIVVCFTPSYTTIVQSKNNCNKSLIHVHDLMNQEYYQMKSINRRFRPVVFSDIVPSELPVGWPCSTIVYEFPSMMNSLFKKLFTTSDLNSTETS